MALEELWNKQIANEKEQGGFLYPNPFGGWSFLEITDNYVVKRNLTELIFRMPSNLPPGSIYIHTHPTQSSLTKFGITNKYKHEPSEDDSEAIVYMNTNYGFNYGVIIDPSYRILIGANGKEIMKANRCGY